jgi:hypothetical protein
VKTVNLYRIEITEPCDVTGVLSNLFGGFYPFIENDMNVKKNWGSFPAGV